MAAELRSTKVERFARLRSLDLSTTPTVSVRADLFLLAPQDYLEHAPGKELVSFLDAVSVSAPRLRFSGRPIARELLANKVRDAIAEQDPSHYMLTFLKAYEILFNGNIIIRHDGEMFAEFVAGARSPSQQDVALACRVDRDPFLSIFRYTNDDPEVRATIYRAIAALPGYGEGRERVYLPGYYEVALGKDPETGRIIPIFYDYRDSAFFVGSRDSFPPPRGQSTSE
jgi:hypothetical protein